MVQRSMGTVTWSLDGGACRLHCAGTEEARAAGLVPAPDAPVWVEQRGEEVGRLQGHRVSNGGRCCCMRATLAIGPSASVMGEYWYCVLSYLSFLLRLDLSDRLGCYVSHALNYSMSYSASAYIQSTSCSSFPFRVFRYVLRNDTKRIRTRGNYGSSITQTGNKRGKERRILGSMTIRPEASPCGHLGQEPGLLAADPSS